MSEIDGWKPVEVNPGSDAAVALGCACPRMDNGYGRGYMGGVKDENGDTVFVILQSCELHGKDMTADTARDTAKADSGI